MDFQKILEQRRACHHFFPGVDIPQEDFEKMVKMSSLTPSGYNAQPWEFVIIQDPENRKKVQQIAFDQAHLSNASAIVIVLGDTNIGRRTEELVDMWIEYGYKTEADRADLKNSIGKVRSPEKRREMALRNAMLAAMTFIYSAEDLGYATCPMMGFSQWQLEEFLELPEDRIIALMIAIGKADQTAALPRLPRRNPKEVIHWEKYSEK